MPFCTSFPVTATKKAIEPADMQQNRLYLHEVNHNIDQVGHRMLIAKDGVEIRMTPSIKQQPRNLNRQLKEKKENY